jgi:hypothetical protein
MFWRAVGLRILCWRLSRAQREVLLHSRIMERGELADPADVAGEREWGKLG